MASETENALSPEALGKLEARVDAWRARIAIPSWTLRSAQYFLLALTEDHLRLRAIGVKAGEVDPHQYGQWLDASKYMLKYALEHVRHLPDEVMRVRPPIDEADWTLADKLLMAHRPWDIAVAAFTSAYAGGTRCYQVDENRYVFRNTVPFRRQANDHLEASTVSVSSPDTVLFRYLAVAERDLPKALRECCIRMRRKDEKRPRITDAVLDEVDALVGARRPVLPEVWTSSLGSGREIARSLRNLWIAGVAHALVATNGGTGRKFLNADGLVGEHTSSWLARIMSRNGGLPEASATNLVELLTYGRFVDRPDPALQFLFALRPGLLAVPWFMYVTCNAERNFLALLARTHRDEFDGASSAFEAKMTSELRDVLRERSWAALFNRTLQGEAAAGEVDAILIDAANRSVLVVELRWFLEPSESREVAEREKSGREKAKKATKKRDAVRRVLPSLLQQLSISSDGDWSIDAVAVFDSYVPTPPASTDVPFVSHRALLSGILNFSRLNQLVAWVRSDSWLPTSGMDFVEVVASADYGDLHIDLDSLDMRDAGTRFVMQRDRALLERWKLVPPDFNDSESD